MQWGEGKVSVSLAREDDAGIEELEPISCNGSGRVAAQAHFLVAQIEALDGDSVVIEHASNGNPIRITRPDEPSTTTVLMPLTWERPVAAAEPARKQAKAGR
jgi:DNA polymerase III sliding clamp (beta) subunit (PCNA family)